MKRKKVLVALGGIVIVLGVTWFLCQKKEGASTITPEYVFTYAENQVENYPTTQGAYKFAELVYAKTNGRIKIKVHPGGELGDEVSVIKQIQYGGIDFARVSIMTLSETVPMFNVLQLPYLYDSSDDMWRILDGDIGQEFMDSLEDYKMEALSWYDAGARHIYTTDKKITRLEDMAGLRIRIAESQLMDALLKGLGAVPVPMAYSEVYSALETGKIDGAENNLPSYESMKHYKVANYITLDGHNRIPELQVASLSTWNKLSEQDQDIIKSCAKESAEYERMLWKNQEKTSKRIVESSGCTITELSEDEIKRFREAVMPIYKEICGPYTDLIDKILTSKNDNSLGLGRMT